MIKGQFIPTEAFALDGLLAVCAMAHFSSYQKARTVACYAPLAYEPDVNPVSQMILGDGKTLVLPRVLNKEHMGFYAVSDLNCLVKNAMGIGEPPMDVLVAPSAIDLMVIPALALTPSGIRLGQGGGYYDRYLEGTAIKTLAIMNEKRVILTIPKEKHDVMVNYYIVNGKIYPCGGK